MNLTREKRFELVSKYIDGNLSDEEIVQFKTALREDAQMSGLLHDLSLQHVLLKRAIDTAASAAEDLQRKDTRKAIVIPFPPVFLRGRKGKWLAAAAMILVLTGAFLFLERFHTQAPASFASLIPTGRVTVHRQDEHIPVSAPFAIRDDDLIRCGDDASGDIRHPEHWMIHMAENTSLVLDDDAPPEGPECVEGVCREGEVTVEHLGGAHVLIIRTPHVSSKIKATHVRFRVLPNGTEIEVSKGQVDVNTEDGVHVIHLTSGRMVRVDDAGTIM